MITLRISHPRPEPLVAEAARLASALTERWLEKDPAVTAVEVTVTPTSHWFVAGRPLAEQQLAAFFLEVRISAGTNTKDQKARFVAEAFQGFRALLGPLNSESYVYVIDANPDAYGFGGLTQERRYIEGRPRAPGVG